MLEIHIHRYRKRRIIKQTLRLYHNLIRFTLSKVINALLILPKTLLNNKPVNRNRTTQVPHNEGSLRMEIDRKLCTG